MALPFLVYRTGLLPAFLVMLVAYIVTAVLHIMVAELSIRTDNASELLGIFTKHLFWNQWARSAFYALMAIVLSCNLAAYITGAGEILSGLLGIGILAGELLFFAFAAIIVFLGLKRVAINETGALGIMVGFLLALSIKSALLEIHQPFPQAAWEPSKLLAVYGMAMFSLSSLFAVPQAACGLAGSKGKLRLAVMLGLFINLLVMALIALCTLACSDPVSEVAIVGWAEALGGTMRIFGSMFIALSMLGTFWSISMQLSDMTKEYFKASRFSAWLAGVAPALVLALLPVSGFLGLMQIAGGATAVVVACMAVPAYKNAVAGSDGPLLGRHANSSLLRGIIAAMYLLMAVASFF